MDTRQLFSNRSDRWQTPVDLLSDVERFFGAQPLDPCPLRRAGEPITSGLWLRWSGAVFCNPPYGRVIGHWVAKALTEPVEELILLVPARTDTAWFAPLFAYPICFLRGRLHFSGAATGAPFPSALVYRGSRTCAFATQFGRRGPVVYAVTARRDARLSLWSPSCEPQGSES